VTPLQPAPVRWTSDLSGVVVLDQTRLPAEEVELELRTLQDVFEAIQSLRVRGAPLIGIVAAMGVAALTRQGRDMSRGGQRPATTATSVLGWCDQLEYARPTAVNLAWALDRMRAAARSAETEALADVLHAEAQAIWDEDARMCRRIGEHALQLITEGAKVLTHCNAGALATGGIGTALAPVYVAHERGMSVRVFADETRPLLQGSRLTAWELGKAGVDVTVITDNTSAALFQLDAPDVVLVGSDRIAANGDVANKVGTYGLAVLARHHGVPFYALAPTSTIDLTTPTGSDIPIEHRSADEVRRGFGKLTAPPNTPVWSPAFDITPAELVTGIVTEQGISQAPFGGSLRKAVANAQPPDRLRGS
jgi:methylthioribose-1-phosphate isomerase